MFASIDRWVERNNRSAEVGCCFFELSWELDWTLVAWDFGCVGFDLEFPLPPSTLRDWANAASLCANSNDSSTVSRWISLAKLLAREGLGLGLLSSSAPISTTRRSWLLSSAIVVVGGIPSCSRWVRSTISAHCATSCSVAVGVGEGGGEGTFGVFFLPFLFETIVVENERTEKENGAQVFNN